MIRRLYAMASKETIEILRDSRTLSLAIILPVIMILLFGYAINFDVDHIETGIVDHDKSAQSRNLVTRLTSGRWFEVKKTSDDVKEIEKALQKGEIKVALVIPENFSAHLKTMGSKTAAIQALIDGSDNNAASVGLNYMTVFFNLYRLSLLEQNHALTGRAFKPAAGRAQLVSRVYFNPELKSRYFILPGIMVLTLAILASLLTSISVAREWERGSMEQLISTPVKPFEILIGKLIPYIFISLFQVALTAIIAIWVFQVPFEGKLWHLFATSFIFAVGGLGLGLLFSSVFKSQLVAMQASIMGTMLPSIFLSGFLYPIDSMPALVKAFTYIVPARYYLVMLRSIFLKGTGFEAYIAETLFLMAFSALVILVARKNTVKEVR